MFQREICNSLIKNSSKQKVSLLLGARRVGKTELLKKIEKDLSPKSLWLNGEDQFTLDLLAERTVANYKRLLQGYEILIIDEAQYVPDIHRKLKLMIDEIKPLHIIITGSSTFDLQQGSEPLVGRLVTYHLYPLAQMELGKTENPLQTKQHLDERLIYGSYPEVVTLATLEEKEKYLTDLINTYLLKDILAFQDVRNPQKIKDLLVLLAYQIGNEVSIDELGKQLGLSKNTVDRYLDLLAKVFVIYNRGGYSNNLRKEVVKSSRWYFYDNGIRNALINNFTLSGTRRDLGMLWENYICSERIKYNEYTFRNVNSYFWRTYDQQEIDLIEEKNAKLEAFEIKWKERKVKIPAAFGKAYPEATFKVIEQINYIDFITQRT